MHVPTGDDDDPNFSILANMAPELKKLV